MGKTKERRDGGKLLSAELHDALRANDEARRSAVMAGGVEPDFVPVAKLFSPVGAATWLATELGEDGDTLFGLCRAQHKPNYVVSEVMLSGRSRCPSNQEVPQPVLTIIGMILTSDDERSMKMVEQKSTVAPVKIDERDWPLVMEFLDHLRQAGMAEGGIQDFPGPAKHFLIWADLNAVPIGAVDVGVVRRFLAHDCACPRPHGERYQHRHMATRSLRTRVLRFVHFLEETGRIHNPVSPDEGRRRVGEFATHLAEQGYSPGTIRAYSRSCRHFAAWLHLHRIGFAAIDDEVLERFATHDCICPGMFLHNARRGYDYQIKLRVFLRFLVSIGVMPRSEPSGDDEHGGLRPFRDPSQLSAPWPVAFPLQSESIADRNAVGARGVVSPHDGEAEEAPAYLLGRNRALVGQIPNERSGRDAAVVSIGE